jgi:hypothetical protein
MAGGASRKTAGAAAISKSASIRIEKFFNKEN